MTLPAIILSEFWTRITQIIESTWFYLLT
ncbi:hypothetical protein TorRG33x02_035250 [Trema orientale]|uniref:Uncharacterized protein n=1 Tax=Trema orientale TaxID=63057 RepID=A0A2P5FSZ6_TREOI|nr:hypothetical protein TorRG33x02_035250 [Trema orientale]